MGQVVLSLKDVAVSQRHKKLFKGVTFDVHSSFFFALLGSNGVGKSTLLRAIMGEHPYSGEITLLGQSHKTLTSKELVKNITYVPQAHQVHFPIPVLEVVAMGGFRHKALLSSFSSEDYQRAGEALDELGVGDLKGRIFKELSGGEQQLVWMAQARLHDAPIVILDEPTQSLDVRNKALFFRHLDSLTQKVGKAVICVTHDLDYLSLVKGSFVNLNEQPAQVRELNSTNLEATKERLRGFY